MTHSGALALPERTARALIPLVAGGRSDEQPSDCRRSLIFVAIQRGRRGDSWGVALASNKNAKSIRYLAGYTGGEGAGTVPPSSRFP